MLVVLMKDDSRYPTCCMGPWCAKGWEQAPCTLPQIWHCSPVLRLLLPSYYQFMSIFLYTKTTLQKVMNTPPVTIICF